MKTNLQVTNREQSLMRPPKVLAPLIKSEIEEGEEAGLEHYRAAGEMLVEAKAQIPHGEWTRWFGKQGFRWSLTQAQRYMSLARASSKTPDRSFSSISQATGETAPRPRPAPWDASVRSVADRVNTSALAQEIQSRREEERLERQLGLQLIDIGFKVLAGKLHPDKPDGSDEAMRRLNRVRKTLQGAL